MNELQSGIDKGNVALLVLLDLSAAFDTIDHNKLLFRLHDEIGISGIAFAWLESYLDNRYQSVIVNGVSSSELELSCGVPQGSVLGPVLFTINIRQIGKIISSYDLLKHFYADDSQLINISNRIQHQHQQLTPRAASATQKSNSG